MMQIRFLPSHTSRESVSLSVLAFSETAVCVCACVFFISLESYLGVLKKPNNTALLQLFVSNT